MSSTAGEGMIRGFIEAVTDRGIVGWAFRQGAATPLALTLSIDGTPASTFSCEAERPDVWDARADVRENSQHGARLGFHVAIPAQFFDGLPHRFDLLIESGESADLITLGRPAGWIREFSFPTLAVLGRVEPAEGGTVIFGWVVVADRMSGTKRTRNQVTVLSSNGASTTLTAEMPRPDVGAALDCDAYCGFRFVPTAALSGPDGATLEFRVQPEDATLAAQPIAIPAIPAPEPEPDPEPVEVPPAAEPAAAEPQPEPEPEQPTPAAESEIRVILEADDGEEPEPVQPVSADPTADPIADPDDGSLRFTGVPRQAVFGRGTRLANLRAALAPAPVHLPDGYYTSEVAQTVAAELDRAFYLSTYRDVAESGLDPVLHYLAAGWREGRMPAPWFDTTHYLAANPDVRDAEVNPFWHYLISGRKEGRRPARPGGYRRGVIEAAVAPELRTADWPRPTAIVKLLASHLDRVLRAIIATSDGFVLSASHDLYIASTGGVQLFIGDEQAAYARRRFAYLNISPAEPDLVFAADTTAGMVRLVLDGVNIGNSSYEDLAEILTAIPARPDETRIFVAHCLLGHHLARLTALQAALAPAEDYCWLHDYSSLCPGFNLLRNDITPCGAPPPGSDGCLVCIHGEWRPRHLAALQTMFEAIPFTVVAPSRPALEIWQRATSLPHQRALVHPHCSLEPVSARTREVPEDAAALRRNPVRVAFIGYPVNHKGWPIFVDLVRRTGRLGCYRFFHFVSPDALVPELAPVHRVDVKASADQRDAMTSALAAHDIDIVLILSPWPETFSYVTFEALAAHADIIALPDSGNVAAMVLEQGRGIIAEEAAIIELFESLRLIEYVRLRTAQGIPGGRLVHAGKSATIAAVAP